jgi:hypothetical protein
VVAGGRGSGVTLPASAAMLDILRDTARRYQLD